MRQFLEYLVLISVGVLLVGSLIGVLLDRPIFISYAYSGSMRPTIEKGDLFFVNPLSRHPEVGDVIVFNANGRWTVHRVIAVTEDGYITKGDNNIAPDQQSGLIPAVRDKDVAGKVVSISGRVIKIPALGNYLGEGLSDKTKLLLGVLLSFLGIAAFSGQGKVARRKKGVFKIRFRALYMMAAVILLITVAISVFVSWEVVPLDYVVTSGGGLREGWYLPGEEFSREVTVKNNNFYPMVYYVSAGGPVEDISERSFSLGPKAEKKFNVTLKAPEDTSIYSTKIRINAYPRTLPVSWITYLHGMGPTFPLLGILGEVAVLLALIYIISGAGNEEILRINRRRLKIRRIAEVFGL